MSGRILILLGLCAVFIGCGDDPDATASWEHSVNGLYAAAVSHDGRFAVVSSATDGASYWDLRANTKLYKWSHGEDDDKLISVVAFSSNDSHVITAEPRSFVVWDVSTGRALGYWGVDADINDAAVSDNARFVLLGLADGRAIHIDQQTHRRIEFTAHQGERVNVVDLSGDGSLAATGGNDGRVMVWRTADGVELHAFDHKSDVTIVRFGPAAERLFTAAERGDATIWDLASGKPVATLALAARQSVISAARFSSDGTRLLLGFPGRDVRLWDGNTGQFIDSWRTPNRKRGWVPQGSTVYAVAFDEGSSTIVAESSNGLGRAWRAASTN
jgi:WD40 repeat protein